MYSVTFVDISNILPERLASCMKLVTETFTEGNDRVKDDWMCSALIIHITDLAVRCGEVLKNNVVSDQLSILTG